jgi:hypothetical protein
VAAAALIGGATAMALASPARADGQTPIYDIDGSAEYVCQANGTFKIFWFVNNLNTSLPAEITAVTATPNTPVSTIVVGATIPANGGLEGSQTVPGNTDTASLVVTAKWTPIGADDITDTTEIEVGFEEDCSPLYTVAQDCKGITFTFTPLSSPEISLGNSDTFVLVSRALISYHVKLIPSTGSPVEFDVTEGDPPKVATFPGSPGLTVDVIVDESEKITEAWTHEPCPLPDTGSNVGTVVAVGAGLVMVGAALIVGLFVLRRRRPIPSA